MRELQLGKADVRRAEEQKQLNTTIEEMRESARRAEFKNEFLVRYVRYLIAEFQLESAGGFAPVGDDPETVARYRKSFVALLEKWWRNQDDSIGSVRIDPGVPYVGRSSYDPMKAQVVFPDGSEWPLPTSIKEEMMDGTKQNSIDPG